MGLFDKLFGFLKPERKIDIEMRFDRLRSSVSGTMSNFFVARDRERNGQIVGVKLCDTEKVAFFESRFKGLNKPSEGKIAISLKHSNVVETYEYGVTNKGIAFIVMEFIDGPGLQQLILNREENLLASHRLSMIRQMADALEYVHRSGYIHRDICPRNFICSADLARVKLIDFGLTLPATKDFMQPGNRTGTPLYMAPEVVRRRPTDQRLDIFSFGVTCYQLLTLELPWPVADASGIVALQHDTSPAKDIFLYRPSLNRHLGNAVMQAMRPNLNERTPDMATFIRSLQNVESEVT